MQVPNQRLKLNLKDRDILLPVNGISISIDPAANVSDVLKLLRIVTVRLHIGDGEQLMPIRLSDIPTGELPEFGAYAKRLKYPKGSL